jgi:glycosyltransferase involved in cell wall biosynthesis
LWVANIKPLKRPEIFVELAKRLPEFDFRMVGGSTDAAWRQAFPDPVPRNLERTGFVPHSEVGIHFDEASVLVNTSVSEGFPNTFLQAWARGVPSLAFFDPQISVAGRALSEVAVSVDDMERRLRRLKTDAPYWEEVSARSRQHLLKEHAVEVVVDRFESLFVAAATRLATNSAEPQ